MKPPTVEALEVYIGAKDCDFQYLDRQGRTIPWDEE